MGGYECEGYSSKEQFFTTYLQGSSRHISYDQFLSSHLPEKARCLSIASGRSINELKLIQPGRDIICTDLDSICMAETLRLFPSFRFVKWNCMEDALLPESFDFVISLGFITLLDADSLKHFLQRMNSQLTPGGTLLLDTASSADSFFANLLHDYYLPIEARCLLPFLNLYRRLKGRAALRVEFKHHGFRYTDDEIVAAAKNAGFTLENIDYMDFENEWDRSLIYRHFLKRVPMLRGLFLQLGKRMPYVRMFTFRSKRL